MRVLPAGLMILTVVPAAWAQTSAPTELRAGKGFIPTAVYSEAEDQKVLALYAGLRVADVTEDSLAQAPKGGVSKTCVPVTDGEVWLVKTGGFWKEGTRYGHYRAVVVRKGIEHATDWVQVQFLEADDKTNSRRTRGCVQLDTPGLKGYVSDLTFTKIDDTRTALSIDVEMKAMNNLILREVFLVDVKGEARRIAEAKYVEVD